MSTKSDNRQLANLPAASRKLIDPSLRRVTYGLGDAVSHGIVLFPISAVFGVVAGRGKHRMDVAFVGEESFWDAAYILECPFALVTRVAGAAFEIEEGHFTEISSNVDDLQALRLCARSSFAVQLASTALSSGCGTITERVARLLLMLIDRVNGESLFCNQEDLAEMLAVRRQSVTDAVQRLQDYGALSLGRGKFTVADRTRLIDASRGLYGEAEAACIRLDQNDTDVLENGVLRASQQAWK